MIRSDRYQYVFYDSVHPFATEDLHGASYDLHLGRVFKYFSGKDEGTAIDTHVIPDESDYTLFNVPKGMAFTLTPHAFVLGHTEEGVQLNQYHCGILLRKSTTARFGLYVSTGFIDPGFGCPGGRQLTLEIYNSNDRMIKIYPGDAICQLAIMKLDGAASRVYSEKNGSHYHDQVGARIPVAMRR